MAYVANICSIPAEPGALAWQGSLLLSGERVGHDPAFAAARRDDLGAGAWVEHVAGWLAGADDLCARLVTELPWESHTVSMYERIVVEPRLTQFRVHDHLDRFAEVAILGAALSARYEHDLARVGAALYRDGADSVAGHGDRVDPSVADPIVAIVSLGAPRRLLLRPTTGGPSRSVTLCGGDLFVMGGTCQRTWQHCVPKTRRAIGPRVSLMFRDAP